ncbi:MAG TPA: hypothetical protein VGL19_10320 [Polyangiaceae bacterium]|jgi:hypothetical protein
MKRQQITGLALFALFAFGAIGAKLASAEEGVLPNATSSGEGGVTTLETTSKEKISCMKVLILEAKFLTEKEKDQHGTANLHFTGCKAEGLIPVNSLGDEKEVVLSKVLFLVCLVEPTKLIFGLLIQPIETEHTEAPAVKTLRLAKGAIIAELEGGGLTGKEFKYRLAGKAGVQTTAAQCTINGTTFKHSFELGSDSASKDVMASVEGKLTLRFPEAITFEDS